MWIESHQAVARHPKTRRLALKLEVSRVTAIGHLHLLWWWAVDFAQDGDVTDIEPETIAEEAMWDGDPAVFVQALKDAGWLDCTADGRVLLHDWHDYAGKLIEARKKDAERKREARQTAVPPPSDPPSGGRPADVQRMSAVTVPNPTVPNRTEQNLGTAPDGAAPASLVLVHPAKAKTPHQAMLDGLVEAFWLPDSDPEWKRFQAVAKALLAAKPAVSPGELPALKEGYRQVMPPGSKPTPPALLSNLGRIRSHLKETGGRSVPDAYYPLRNVAQRRLAQEESA